MIHYYLLILGYTLASSLAALLLKLAMGRNEKVSLFLARDPFFCTGILLYFLASIGSIIALKHLPYSTVYFLSAFTYVWTVLLSGIFLKEKIDIRISGALGLILSGIYLVIR